MMGRKAQIRCHLYGSLAAAFDEPGALMEDALLTASQRASQELPIPSLRAEVVELEALIEASQAEPTERVRRRLDVEHNRLFGGAGHPIAPPWESFYRGAKGWEGDPLPLELVGIYAEEGLSVAQDYRGLPDHITPELEFMARLCGKEALAWEEMRLDDALECRRREKAFLERHLNLWVPTFCRKMLSSALEPLYLSLASITLCFLSWETTTLADLGSETDAKVKESSCSWEVKVTQDLCTFCEACVLGCPWGALWIEREQGEALLVFKGEGCDGCRLCERLCPEGAITLKKDVSEKEGVVGLRVVARSPLASCIRCGRPSEPGALLKKVSEALDGSSFVLLCSQCRLKGMVTQRAVEISKQDLRR